MAPPSANAASAPMAIDSGTAPKIRGSQGVAAVTALAPVRDLELHEPDIEDVVRKIYAEGA